MKITPSGTRTCVTSSPFGRRLDAITSPTGSGRRGDLLEARRDRLQPLRVERSRSIAAAFRPEPGRGRDVARRWPRGSRPIGRGSALADRLQPAVLRRAGRNGQGPRRDLGAVGHVSAFGQEVVVGDFAHGIASRRVSHAVHLCAGLASAWRALPRSLGNGVPPSMPFPDLEGVDHRADVVDPDDPGSRRGRGERRDDRGDRPVARSVRPVSLPGTPCARCRPGATQPRSANRFEVPQERQVVLERLAEADAGVDRDPRRGRSPRVSARSTWRAR